MEVCLSRCLRVFCLLSILNNKRRLAEEKFFMKTWKNLSRNWLIFTILIVLSLGVLSGCSSSPETSRTANAANQPAANPANANTLAATNSNPPGAPAVVPYNGVQNINPNAFNAANDSNLKVIPYQPKPGELPYGTRTAPDDSIVSSGSRGRDFVETRSFKSHAVLSKVEKIMDGKTTSYKVFLKNGKVVDAPADKMTNFTAMAPESILDAIGMMPKPVAVPEDKKQEKPQ